jgi:D-alanine-D-alanine ligase
MKIGLICERKDLFPFLASDPKDIHSELASIEEEDELTSGLQDAGHTVLAIHHVSELLSRLSLVRQECDLIFNQSTGERGMERMLFVPALLEVAGLPYVGSTPYVHALLRHKHHAKLVAASAGVPAPPGALVDGRGEPDLSAISFPAIVKPVAESSSIGIDARSVVANARDALERARRLVIDYRQPALIETFVRGTEIEVPILVDPEPRALGVAAITLDGAPIAGDIFLTSDAVFDDGYGFGPAPGWVDARRVMAAAIAAAEALGLRDYGRIDLRVSEDGTPWFMEADTVPHIQRHSSFFFLAQRLGLAYHQMLDELVQIAVKRLRAASNAVPRR